MQLDDKPIIIGRYCVKISDSESDLNNLSAKLPECILRLLREQRALIDNLEKLSEVSKAERAHESLRAYGNVFTRLMNGETNGVLHIRELPHIPK